MTPRTIDEQLTKYLTDAHSVEQQALVQMRVAPRLAGSPQIAAIFSEHLNETAEHERLIAQRLEARGARPSRVKDVAGLVTGAGFAAFAAAQPDTPGKLIVHAYSYEHMEEAAYNLLGRVADQAGDREVAEVAQRIEAQERTMGERIAGCFDLAVAASLKTPDRDEADRRLSAYLTDAHAIEGQALELLAKSPKLSGAPELAVAYDEHRHETQHHRQLVAERLRSRGASPSRVKDAALRVGALNWGAFFGAQPDTPAKLAGFAYAFEHLEIGSYEMLRRVATQAGDEETVRVAVEILAQERTAAERIRGLLGTALEATLQARGLVAA